MKKIIITENQIKFLTEQTINHHIKEIILTENYGINDNFENDIDKVEKIIFDKIKKCKVTPYYKTQGKGNATIEIKVNNVPIKIYLIVYHFIDEEEKNEFLRSSIVPLGYIETMKILHLPVFIVNKRIDYYDLIDTIGHEMKHIFQTTKMGHDFAETETYRFAISNLGSNDIYKRNVANVLYASNKSEQEGFIEGLYRQIKQYNKEKLVDYIIKDSEAYAWLMKLYEGNRFLSLNKDDIRLINLFKENNIGLGVEKILKLSEEGINNLERRIARVVKKTKDILIRENRCFPEIKANGINQMSNFYMLAD